MSARLRGSFLAAAAMASALLAGSAAVPTPALAGAGAAQSGGTWHNAIKLTGPTGQVIVTINSLSCPSAGNCLAGGYFRNEPGGRLRAMLVTERAGHWGRAIEVPGTAANNAGYLAVVESVSCSSAGNCAADGTFETKATNFRTFVIEEVAGRWGQLHFVRGGSIALGHPADTLSCPSPGNCVIGGTLGTDAFVADETNGHWGHVLPLAGAGLKSSDGAGVGAIACLSPGNCVASGSELIGVSNSSRLFAVTETGGHWGQAVAISTSKINIKRAGFAINSISCYSPGNCAAGGLYVYRRAESVYEQPLVISEIGGHWRPAMYVPGLTRPRTPVFFGQVYAVSCVSPGTCTASGSYPDSKTVHAFVVTDTGGHWGKAVTISPAASIGGGRPAAAASVSCTSPGNCVAGGYFSRSGQYPYLVTKTGGKWGRAQSVPGEAKLTPIHEGQITSISCPSAGHCTAIGVYDDSRAFAATEN